MAQQRGPERRNSLAQSVHIVALYAVFPGGVSEGHSADRERVNIRNGHSASFEGYTPYADHERQESFRRVARAYGCSHYPAR